MDKEMKISMVRVVLASTIFLSFVFAVVLPELLLSFGVSPETYALYVQSHPIAQHTFAFYSFGLGMFSILFTIILLASIGMYSTLRGQNID